MTEQPRMNVESFNLDHRTVAAPYLRIADRKELPGGDVLTKFDVRFTQPNVEHLDSEAVHSLEHMMAEHMRNHSGDVIDVSPMGCRTGFTCCWWAITTSRASPPVLEATLRDLVAADEVPPRTRSSAAGSPPHPRGRAGRGPCLPRAARWGTVTAA